MLDYEFLYVVSLFPYLIGLVVSLVKRHAFKAIVINSLFYFYCVALIAVTLFPIPIQGLSDLAEIHQGASFLQAFPLVGILDILRNDYLPFIVKMRQIFGNIILFIPLGFFLPILWKNRASLKKLLPIGFGVSLAIELTQLIISLILGYGYKITDVDDLILNTLGFILGFGLYKAFRYGLD